MPACLKFEVHSAPRLRTPEILASPVTEARWRGYSDFAGLCHLQQFQIKPLNRIKIAYSYSTPKRLALLVALIPVKAI